MSLVVFVRNDSGIETTLQNPARSLSLFLLIHSKVANLVFFVTSFLSVPFLEFSNPKRQKRKVQLQAQAQALTGKETCI
jgi:hypothetical protein